MYSSRRSDETLLLALRELEARACALLSVLLALFLSGITRQISGSLEHSSLRSIELLDGARDSVAQSTCLTGYSASGERRVDVVTPEALRLVEGRADHDLERGAGKVLVHLAAIDRDLPGAEGETNTGDCAFALTGRLDRATGGL